LDRATPVPPTTPVWAPKSRLDALTILRFAAALWVVVLHLQYRAPLAAPPLLRRFFLNGACAMTLFFVLSGVVLAYGYHRLRPHAPEIVAFYQARFARIYVPYALLHVLALGWFAPANAQELSAAIYINALSALGLQAWFPNAAMQGANGGTWSISVEFFFYALFPALLPCLAYLRRRWGTLRVAAYVSALSALIGFADYVFANSALLYYVMPAARLPEFMLGILLGLTLLDPPHRPFATPLSLAVACGALLVAALNPALDYGTWIRANFFVVPAFGLFIYELARWDQRRPAGPPGAVWRSLVYLGEASYCLFLVHMLPALFLDSAPGRAWKAQHWPGSALGLWVLFIAVSLLGAIALHELVEKPVRRALLRRWQPNRPTAPAT